MVSTLDRAPPVWGRVKTIEALLTSFFRRSYLRRKQRIGHDKKTGEVTAVGLDAAFEYFETVEPGGIVAADGCVTGEMLFGDLFGATGCVKALDHLKVGVAAQILLTLHQRHRVRINL